MGWTPEETHYKLHFEDPAYSGLEVVVAEVSTGTLMELAELTGSVESMDGFAKAKALTRLFTLIGESLVSWNLEKPAGNPVAATIEGVKEQTLKFNLAITLAWISAMAEVDIPLPEGLNSGASTEMEASIPMALSQ
jgi:hypothetical protein